MFADNTLMPGQMVKFVFYNMENIGENEKMLKSSIFSIFYNVF